MNAHDAERAVLGALRVSSAAFTAVAVDEGLTAQHFRLPAHQAIYAAMAAAHDSGGAFDDTEIRGRLAGQALQAFDALTAVPAAGMVRGHARRVREAALIRGLTNAAGELRAAISRGDTDPRTLLEQHEAQILALSETGSAKQPRPVGDVLAEEQDRIHRLTESGGGLTGVPTGLSDLDQLTGGLQPGNLVVIASRPAMGKSALAAGVAVHAAARGYRTVMFTLEMTDGEVAQRLIAAGANVTAEALRRGKVRPHQWERIIAAGQQVASTPLLIDDTTDLSVTELRAKARRLHQRDPLGLIVVDYLQLLRAPKGMPRVEAVGEISRGLKVLAGDLNVPVVALAQLSRQLENRGVTPESKRPMLSDLRESGAIEQDANVVVFVWREDAYTDNPKRPGVAELIVAKHRAGRTGTVEVAFDGAYTQFTDLEPQRVHP